MTQEDAIRKALACLRLAKSSNPAEAALAAAKAQEIITKFNLDISSADYEQNVDAKDKEEVKYFNNDPIDDVERAYRGWTLRLCSELAHVNCCRLIQSPNIDGKGGKRLMVIGRPSDVSAVRYLYAYFKQEVIRLCEENTRGNSGTYKNHYMTGVVDAINEKLWSQKYQTETAVKNEYASNPMALVKVNNALAKQEKYAQDVEDFISKMKWGKARSSGYTNGDSGGRAHGRRDGANVRWTNARGGIGRGTAGQLTS